MIQYTKYQAQLNDELVNKVLEDLNYFEKFFYQTNLENPNDKIDNTLIMYFATTGGELAVADVIVNALNDFNLRHKLRLVAYKEISSAGFDVFANYKGAKMLMPNTVSILHLATMDFTSRDLENKSSISSVLYDDLKKSYQEFLSSITILTKAEKDLISKGGEVTLTYPRLKKYFKCQ